MELNDESKIGEPRFNSAIDTLERLSVILRRIAFLHILYPKDKVERQKEHIELMKSFFEMGTVLFSLSIIEKYSEEILDLKIRQKSYIKSGVQKYTEYYDPILEKRLREISIKLQYNIRKYFMPSGEDDLYAL